MTANPAWTVVTDSVSALNIPTYSDARRVGVVEVYNGGPDTVYVATDDDTPGVREDGSFEILVGNTVSIDYDSSVYGVCASGDTANVSVWIRNAQFR